MKIIFLQEAIRKALDSDVASKHLKLIKFKINFWIKTIHFNRGYHGLWFDGDLLNGHTQKSKTYDNEPVFNFFVGYFFLNF